MLNWLLLQMMILLNTQSYLGMYGNAILTLVLAVCIGLCVVQLTRDKKAAVTVPAEPEQPAKPEAKDEGIIMAEYKKARREHERLVNEYLVPRLIVTVEQAWWAERMTKRQRDAAVKKIAMAFGMPEWLPDGWQKILKAQILRDRATRTAREKAPVQLPDRTLNEPPPPSSKEPPPPPTAVTTDGKRRFTIGKFRPKAA